MPSDDADTGLLRHHRPNSIVPAAKERHNAAVDSITIEGHGVKSVKQAAASDDAMKRQKQRGKRTNFEFEMSAN